MRRTKAIHEMKKWHSRLERRNLRNDGHVMSFLNTKAGQHGQAATTDQHGITVVAVNGQGFASESTRRHVDDGRKQLAGNLVQIGNIEQQALRRSKGRGESS